MWITAVSDVHMHWRHSVPFSNIDTRVNNQQFLKIINKELPSTVCTIAKGSVIFCFRLSMLNNDNVAGVATRCSMRSSDNQYCYCQQHMIVGASKMQAYL